MDYPDLHRRLVSKAYLFEDPEAYAAGVSDALEAVGRLEAWRTRMDERPDAVSVRVGSPATRRRERPAVV